MTNKILLFAGYASPIVFWLTTFMCGLLIGNYSHTTNMVSELGALGTRTQYIFTSGLVLCSLFSLFFVIGLLKTAKEKKLKTIPLWLILLFTFSTFSAAIFPMPTRLHGLLGSPSIFLFLSPLLALFLLKEEIIPKIKTLSIIVFLLMGLGFTVFLPEVLSDYFGVKQRFFHFGWSLWFMYLAYSFSKLNST